MTDATRDPLALHRNALVIDSLVYHADGWADHLRAGAIDAINVTACHFECDFEQACQEVARWRERLAQPDSAWMGIETVADFDKAKAAGKIGAILGWQNTRPIADRIDRLYLFYKLGLRIMQLTYNYRNMIGDGCLEHSDCDDGDHCTIDRCDGNCGCTHHGTGDPAARSLP